MLDVADGGRGGKLRRHPASTVSSEREADKVLYRDGCLINKTVGGIGRNT
jgi:hypothetical protein